jgi:rhodanese-related sulfurtransferase
MPSVQAAVAAQEMGYKKIMLFRDGFPEWKKKGYEIEK